MGVPGGSGERLGDHLGHSWAVLRVSWGGLGGSGGLWGAPIGMLGDPSGDSGGSLGSLVGPWGCIGVVFGAPWAILEATYEAYGPY